MELGLGRRRHWGRLRLIPAMILAVGIFFRLLKDYKARCMNIGTVDESAALFCEDESEVATL